MTDEPKQTTEDSEEIPFWNWDMRLHDITQAANDLVQKYAVPLNHPGEGPEIRHTVNLIGHHAAVEIDRLRKSLILSTGRSDRVDTEAVPLQAESTEAQQ